MQHHKTSVKRYWVISISIIALGITVLILLASYVRTRTYRGGGFLRAYADTCLYESSSVFLRAGKYYLIAATDAEIYIGDRSRPATFISIDRNSGQYYARQISSTFNGSLSVTATHVAIDFPALYLVDGTGPTILRGSLEKGSNVDQETATQHFFTDLFLLSRESALIRSISRDQRYMLGKLNLRTGEAHFDTTILKKQIDGLFCVNGQVSIDEATGNIAYAYSYRNEFVVLDSSLNLLCASNTVDTTSRAKIRLVDDPGSGTRYLASPPVVVNKAVSLFDDHLFICSSMTADNDDHERMNNYSPIDIYGISSGKYLGSFLIPHYHGTPLTEFRVIGKNLIVALYPDAMVTWRMSRGAIPE